MNFTIEDSPEQRALRAEVRAFLEEHLPEGLEFPADSSDVSFEQYQKRREMGRKLGARGWLYPTWPKEYGGGGMSADQAGVIHEELTRVGLASPPYYDTGAVMGGPTILVWGTEEQKRRFIPPMCRGEVRTWQLLSEPGAGSDLAGVRMTAIRDGDVYVLNGQKTFVGSTYGADYSWTIVVTDPKGERHKNLSWIMVPMNLPGISVVPMDLLSSGGEGGTGCGVKNNVFFDNVRVPADHLVGEENSGWKMATTHLEVEHGGTGRLVDSDLVGRFIDFCRERRDGWAIADDPDARAELVELYIKAQVARLLGLRNYWLAHAGQPRTYEGPQYALLRKRTALDASEKMLRIAGPYVLSNDARWGPLQGALEYFQRDAICMQHPGGTGDIQRVIMSRRIGISGREREKAGDLR